MATTAEQAPKKDWREVERERAEKQRLRWRKIGPVLMAATVMLCAAAVVMVVRRPHDVASWLNLLTAVFALSGWYSLWRAEERGRQK